MEILDPASLEAGGWLARRRRPARPRWAVAGALDAHPLTIAVLGLLCLLLAAATTVGADTLWMAALGDAIGRTGAIPTGIPFAAADSSGWSNVPVLGELVIATVQRAGTAGLLAAQVGVAVAVLSLVAVEGRRRGATDPAVATVLVLVAVAAAPALAVVRAQTLSLLPCVVLLMLLRSERGETTRVWLLPVVLAIWANLHGAVLVGLAVTEVRLLIRIRHDPTRSIPLAVACFAAVLVTPAGPNGTISYYRAVLANQAAARGSDLWAPLELSRPFDLVLVAGAVPLVLSAFRARPPAWERLVLVALTLATVLAARNGIWLVLVAAGPATAGLAALRRRPAQVRRPTHPAVQLGVGLSCVVVAAAVFVSRTDRPDIVETAAARIHALAGRSVVLAPEPLAEQLAADGTRLWLSDPLDAFCAGDQNAYLDFVAGIDSPGLRRALSESDVVVVPVRFGARPWLAGRAVVARVADYLVLARPD